MPEVEGIQFDNVLDAVDDLGMDPNGNAEIDSILDNNYQEGNLIQFPPGTYRVESENVISGTVSRFGIEGTGSDKTDVTFTFPNATNAYRFIDQSGGSGFLIKNCELDTDNLLIGLRMKTADKGVIKDVKWTGWLPERDGYPGQLIDLSCTSVSGVNRAEGVVIGMEGSWVHGHSYETGRTGVTGFRFYDGDHVGETIIRDLHIEQLSSNGIRHTKGDGVVKVYDSVIKNSHLAATRIHNGDHPSKDSLVKDCRLIIDHANAGPIGDGEWHSAGGAAVMLDSTDHARSQATYERCQIVCNNTQSPDGWGLIRCNNNGLSNPGGGVFKDCTIVNDTNLQTFWTNPREPEAEAPQYWTFDNCEFVVKSDNQYKADAAIYMEGNWDGTQFTDTLIYTTDGTVSAIDTQSDVTLTDCVVETAGQNYVTDGATVTENNVTNNVADYKSNYNEFQIVADDSADLFEYTLTVSGDLEWKTYGDYPANFEFTSNYDEIIYQDDGTIDLIGHVAGYGGTSTEYGGDTFRYTGEITSINVNGPATLYRNGTQVTESELSSGSGGGSTGTHVIRTNAGVKRAAGGILQTRDKKLSVSTGSASNIAETEVQLAGDVLEYDAYDTATAYFEYRETGASTWIQSSGQTITDPGAYSETITGLSSATDYEYRAVVTTDYHDDTDTGTTSTFTTASSVAIVDSFEDGDLSEYSVYNPANNTTSHQVVDESTVSFSAVDGSKMLEMPTGSSNNPLYYSHPGDGLANYFSKGQELTYYLRKEDANRTDVSFCFGLSGDTGDDHYRVVLQWNAFYCAVLQNRSGGSTSSLDNNSDYDLNNGVWYEIVIRWDDGTLGGADNDITVTINEGVGGTQVAQLSANDATHATESGIGWLPEQRDYTVWADYAHISN